VALPANIDIDKLLSITLDRVRAAICGWLQGIPKDEVALMNRLTEKLSHVQRGCDVGLGSRVVVKARLASLHRMGPGKTDLFGSDLGVTVFVEGNDYLKTALFQFKRGTNFRVQVEAKQLQDSHRHPHAKERSFVCYVDEDRSGVRISSAAPLLEQFEGSQATRTFDTATWLSLTEWFTAWLSCDLGPMSELGSRDSIEAILKEHEHAPDVVPQAKEALNPFAWLLFAYLPEGLDVHNTAVTEYFDRGSGPRQSRPGD